MDKKQLCAGLRREFNKTGFALLIYYAIMNVSVTAVAAVDIVGAYLTEIFSGNCDFLFGAIPESVLEEVLGNGWGYIFATLIGAVVLLFWKKKQFCFVEIWKVEKNVGFGSFLALLCLFVGSQAFFQIFAEVIEKLFNLFGFSVMASLESASVTSDTFSMFLYIALIAPISEEILFRGLILRTLLPYGKKFSILASAFLFGIFHGNIIQSPFAFVVGLILGYTAAEYSIHWAIVLHVFNNMILGEVLTRAMNLLPGWLGELIFFVILWVCAVASIVILLVKLRQIIDYFRFRRVHPLCLKCFFTSPGVLILTLIMTVGMLAMIFVPF